MAYEQTPYVLYAADYFFADGQARGDSRSEASATRMMKHANRRRMMRHEIQLLLSEEERSRRYIIDVREPTQRSYIEYNAARQRPPSAQYPYAHDINDEQERQASLLLRNYRKAGGVAHIDKPDQHYRQIVVSRPIESSRANATNSQILATADEEEAASASIFKQNRTHVAARCFEDNFLRVYYLSDPDLRRSDSETDLHHELVKNQALEWKARYYIEEDEKDAFKKSIVRPQQLQWFLLEGHKIIKRFLFRWAAQHRLRKRMLVLQTQRMRRMQESPFVFRTEDGRLVSDARSGGELFIGHEAKRELRTLGLTCVRQREAEQRLSLYAQYMIINMKRYAFAWEMMRERHERNILQQYHERLFLVRKQSELGLLYIIRAERIRRKTLIAAEKERRRNFYSFFFNVWLPQLKRRDILIQLYCRMGLIVRQEKAEWNQMMRIRLHGFVTTRLIEMPDDERAARNRIYDAESVEWQLLLALEKRAHQAIFERLELEEEEQRACTILYIAYQCSAIHAEEASWRQCILADACNGFNSSKLQLTEAVERFQRTMEEQHARERLSIESAESAARCNIWTEEHVQSPLNEEGSDTLSSLAARYGVTEEKLREFNPGINFSSNQPLLKGMAIRIPIRKKTPPPPPMMPASPKAEPKPVPKDYEHGQDSLNSLATKYGISLRKLMKFNPGIRFDPDKPLPKGVELRIPVRKKEKKDANNDAGADEHE